jgi:geranylgeranyl diphosphate synthase type II
MKQFMICVAVPATAKPVFGIFMAVSEKDFKRQLERKVEIVNKTLGRILRKPGRVASELTEPMRYVLESPGKRIRGCVVLWCCELAGGKISHNARIAAAAIEMVHTYSLIHDDLPAMDDDDYRRGRLTCHKKYDEATAILVGDALLTLAFELLAKEIDKPETAVRLTGELAEAAGPSGMVAGQMADLKATDKSEIRNPTLRNFFEISRTLSPKSFRFLGEFETNSNAQKKKIQNKKNGGVPTSPRGLRRTGNPALLKRIHTNKTAKMFRCAAAMGGICGGANERQLKRLHEFGLKLGLGFQIADDILDVCGSSEELGKTSGKDARQGKATYPSVVGLEKSRELARKIAGEAVEALKPFGEKAEELGRLAGILLNRTK